MQTTMFVSKYLCRIYYLLILGLIAFPNLILLCTNNTTLMQGEKLLAFVYLLYCYYKLFSKRMLVWPKGKELFLLFGLFLISIYIISRAEWQTNNVNNFFLKVLDDDTISYLLPFIIIPLPNKQYLNKILHVLYNCSVFVILIWLLNLDNLVQEKYYGERVGVYLPFISAFLLGFPKYFTTKQNRINLIITLVYLVLMMLNARRNVSFSIFIILLIYYFLNFFLPRKKRIITIVISILSVIVLLVCGNVLIEKNFNRFAERIDDDSRSGVEELFFNDFLSSSTSDWFFGRGMDGGYYQEIRNKETNEITTNRTGIETGYLNMILHGGIVYVIIVFSLFFISFNRTFKNKSLDYRFVRFLMLLFLIDCYTTCIVNPFYVRTVIFWLCISFLNNRSNDSSKQFITQS